MFKFTIREVILMTTIVAILLMWWMETSRNAKNEARLIAIETRLNAMQAPAITKSVLPLAANSGPIVIDHTQVPPATTWKQVDPTMVFKPAPPMVLKPAAPITLIPTVPTDKP